MTLAVLTCFVLAIAIGFAVYSAELPQLVYVQATGKHYVAAKANEVEVLQSDGTMQKIYHKFFVSCPDELAAAKLPSAKPKHRETAIFGSPLGIRDGHRVPLIAHLRADYYECIAPGKDTR